MKFKNLIVIIAIILALVLIKIFFLQGDEKSASSKNKNKPNAAINVSAIIVQTEQIENKLFASGTVLANEEVALRPEISGRLLSVFFKEGASVKKGTLLAKINDADLQAQLRKLQAQLKLGKERETRIKGLLAIGGVSQEEFDILINQNQSLLSDIDYVRAQIAKTEIRAPFSGKIGLKQISAGSFVSNLDVLATMQQLDFLKIDFAVPEKYASVVKIGDLIKFSVENNEALNEAKVFALEPKVDENTRNITIRAKYNNEKSNIFPGAFAKIELISSEKNDAIMIPTESVIPELKGKKVFLFNAGKAVPIIIKTGLRNDSKIEIVSGLKVGDTVITTGIMSLKPNEAVKIININQ